MQTSKILLLILDTCWNGKMYGIYNTWLIYRVFEKWRSVKICRSTCLRIAKLTLYLVRKWILLHWINLIIRLFPHRFSEAVQTQPYRNPLLFPLCIRHISLSWSRTVCRGCWACWRPPWESWAQRVVWSRQCRWSISLRTRSSPPGPAKSIREVNN